MSSLRRTGITLPDFLTPAPAPARLNRELSGSFFEDDETPATVLRTVCPPVEDDLQALLMPRPSFKGVLNGDPTEEYTRPIQVTSPDSTNENPKIPMFQSLRQSMLGVTVGAVGVLVFSAFAGGAEVTEPIMDAARSVLVAESSESLIADWKGIGSLEVLAHASPDIVGVYTTAAGRRVPVMGTLMGDQLSLKATDGTVQLVGELNVVSGERQLVGSVQTYGAAPSEWIAHEVLPE